MKISIMTLLMFFLLLFNNNVIAQSNIDNRNIQNVSSTIVEAFKYKDYSKLENLIATKEDLEEWFQTYSYTLPVEKQREFVSGLNEGIKKGHQGMYESFNGCYSQGVDNGINWPRITNSTSNLSSVGEAPMPKESISGLEVGIKYLGVDYTIFIAVVKVKRGWVLFDKFKFY